jgi:outer membrane protein OmpA-like peptidoglycan-associated protein
LSRLAAGQRVDVYGIYFDFNSDRVRPESEPVLRDIGEILRRNQEWRLYIDGHTDGTGSAAANMDLSRRRSEAVRAALIGHGIAADRLSTRGYGATVPRDTNVTPKERSRNHRVELVRQ